MLASFLAFVLGKNDGKYLKIRASELQALHECLAWLREYNPHLQAFWSNVEKFGLFFGSRSCLFTIADKAAPVSSGRKQQRRGAQTENLGSTIGHDEAALAVFDPQQFPKNWHEINDFATKIATVVAREATATLADIEKFKLPRAAE